MANEPAARPEAEGRVPPVPDDRELLREFPRTDLARGTTVWRAHDKGKRPWFFSGGGRFGLLPAAGTCYVAEDPLTTICETVIRGRTHVCPDDLAKKAIRGLSAPKEFALADSPSASGFGIGRSFGTEHPYDTCREWALALYGVGFRGVAYWPSHDPRRGDRVSLALFDVVGERKRWRVGRAEDLSSAPWRSRIEADIGVQVLDPPGDDELEFVEGL